MVRVDPCRQVGVIVLSSLKLVFLHLFELLKHHRRVGHAHTAARHGPEERLRGTGGVGHCRHFRPQWVPHERVLLFFHRVDACVVVVQAHLGLERVVCSS